MMVNVLVLVMVIVLVMVCLVVLLWFCIWKLFKVLMFCGVKLMCVIIGMFVVVRQVICLVICLLFLSLIVCVLLFLRNWVVVVNVVVGFVLQLLNGRLVMISVCGVFCIMLWISGISLLMEIGMVVLQLYMMLVVELLISSIGMLVLLKIWVVEQLQVVSMVYLWLLVFYFCRWWVWILVCGLEFLGVLVLQIVCLDIIVFNGGWVDFCGLLGFLGLLDFDSLLFFFFRCVWGFYWYIIVYVVVQWFGCQLLCLEMFIQFMYVCLSMGYVFDWLCDVF